MPRKAGTKPLQCPPSGREIHVVTLSGSTEQTGARILYLKLFSFGGLGLIWNGHADSSVRGNIHPDEQGRLAASIRIIFGQNGAIGYPWVNSPFQHEPHPAVIKISGKVVGDGYGSGSDVHRVGPVTADFFGCAVVGEQRPDVGGRVAGRSSLIATPAASGGAEI